MINKIYCAGKFEDKTRIKNIMAVLEKMGYIVTVDWTIHTDPTKAEEYSIEDVQGVRDCDLFIGIFNMDGVQYKGALVEMGVALGLRKMIIYVGKEDISIFAHHPLVIYCETVDEMLKLLENHIKTENPFI